MGGGRVGSYNTLKRWGGEVENKQEKKFRKWEISHLLFDIPRREGNLVQKKNGQVDILCTLGGKKTPVLR